MTPGARVAAAIEILDRILSGEPAERALTTWARGSRFAGSGDRAAIRDHVFDALRCRRSYGALGGGADGRALMIGWARVAGVETERLFSGEGHAPPPLGGAECAPPTDLADLPDAVRLDVPDWLMPELDRSLGADLEPVLEAMRMRAPVFVRVNRARGGRQTATERLAEEGIAARAHPLAKTALEITENARRLRQSAAYREGLVELQDAASQAAVETLLPVATGAKILDYCAGGGGKALALAAATGGPVAAHDADPGRMADIPARVARAGAEIARLSADEAAARAPWDLVLADVPCSGSGAWRRQPEAKWTLTPERLAALRETQAAILDRAAALIARGGRLAYATCSLLDAENGDQIDAFLGRHAGWREAGRRRFTPLDGGDGFFIALLTRE